MNESVKLERAFDQLGLPPLELAESSANGRSSNGIQKCFYPAIQKLFFILLTITFGIGIYILLAKLLENADSVHSTEIIVVTGLHETPNITVHKNYMDIFLEIKNKTIDPEIKRKKRHTNYRANKRDKDYLKNNDLIKAKDIIMKHGILCHNENMQEKCKDLIMKLKSIMHKEDFDSINENELFNEHPLRTYSKKGANDAQYKKHDDNSNDISKREAVNMPKLQSILESSPITPMERDSFPYGNPANIMPHPQQSGSTQLADTCLLARLLKQNYPYIHGIYDAPIPEYSHYDQPAQLHNRYFPSGIQPYLQSRDIESKRRKLHPQDVDIFMSFLTPKPNSSTTENPSKSSIREVECPEGSISCDSGDACIAVKQWCDGSVDCDDVSDEMKCSCKSRVDKSRLCDGYFDCPFGEDEMGCFGCSDNTFSCADVDMSSESSCFTKEQRCNNIVECPNHKDEMECNMLAPSLVKKPLYAISNTEGFLHRNFKGDWYAVCQNPYMWAHDACRRETGLIIRPPFIQVVPIDPLLKVNYLNTGPGGLIQTSDTCFNSSAMYVTCPDFLCGTRVQTTSQFLREDSAVENHLFGRNKRFLVTGHPYPFMFYGNRMKREINLKKEDSEIESDTSEDSESDEVRNKRAESRVVGGKPSQPAAWPWMVAIYRNGMFHCGGVILTQSWVISAAHCVHKFWDHYYEIQVGMLRRFSFSPQEQNHRVTHVIVNQHYSQVDMKDDLSLLKVEPAIQFSRWVRPICLPGSNTAGPDWMWGPSPGTICTAVGWGATMEHGPDPDHLREVEVPVWEHCKHREDRAGKEICAGLAEGGKDACQGDSGGPLLCRNPLSSQQWYLAGIVSHGDGCARKGEPGVYTRVSLFVKWIKYHTSSKSLPIVQPIQVCPGFKCESGISKCLPNSRKCDKTIDCLDGEDEIKCDFMRSAHTFNSSKFITTTAENKAAGAGKTLIMKEAEIKVPERSESNTTDSFIITEELTTVKILFMDAENMNNNNVNLNINNAPKDSDRDITSSELKNVSEPDFEHASTIEMPFSRSAEEFKTSSEEVTADPTRASVSDETVETTASDLQTITMSFSKASLESRSSVLEQIKTEKNDQESNDNYLKLNVQPETTQSDFTSSITTFMQEDTENQAATSEPTTPINLEENFPTTSNHDDADKPKITDRASQIVDNKAGKRSDELVIELLPTTETNLLSEDDESKILEHENNLNNENKSTSDKKNQTSSVKKNNDFEDKSDMNHEIEGLVLSELQPAKIRRKHRNPKEFECRRIFQIIPYHHRCDHKADCEDGTDELDCTCTDYLSTFDEKLICDGVFDCADGQDEIGCFTCEEDNFLCKRSEVCLSTKYVCDGKSHCPQGEDELDCFALTNGKDMEYDTDGRPKINLEGYLTRRHDNDWHVVCEDKITIDQQEQAATHICHYLGFSSANRHYIKYINIRDKDLLEPVLDENKRNRRETSGTKPILFTYREINPDNDTARNIIIKEPQVIKEQCVPNITKTCKSLYVFCDHSLFTNFDFSQEILFDRAAESVTTHMWPWVAKVHVDGDYRCTGILVDISWVLVSDSCLWDLSLTHNYVSALLGSHRTLSSTNGLYEKVHKVDAKKDLYRNRAALLHLKEPAQYSNMVKPMVISSFNFHHEQKTKCVAVGQDNNNNTVSVFLEETNKFCNLHNRCFVRRKENICTSGKESHRQWAGIISCHNEQGWYPAASFVDSRGECGLGDLIVGTDIENLRKEIKYYSEKLSLSNSVEQIDTDFCEGERCSRGRCVPLHQVCDGVRICEDGNDESEQACKKKSFICEADPHHRGCQCSRGQMKCRNGKCISKELFRDGHDDCGDGTDEPGQPACSDYLARVMPSRLCDGILHCQDRSDEDPLFCKCFAKRFYKCGPITSDVDHCVAPDMVCDGVQDCPNGEDESTCIALNAPQGTPYGTGQVIVRSHGVWHSKCYPTQNHTKSELEAICKELGFLGGHAKQIKEIQKLAAIPHNNFVLDSFSEVTLNNKTVIKMRNTLEPIARAVFDDDLKNCFPVFIECY